MTDQDKMRARLDELWSSYVLESYPDTKPDTEDRAISAIKLLENLRTIHADAKEKGDTEKVARSIDLGLSVWSLLSIELGDWLVDWPGSDVRNQEEYEGKEQRALIYKLALANEVFFPSHAAQIDLVPLILPRWLHVLLLNGMQALQKGEVQPLLEPNVSNRHDATWTRDEMRARALQHVEFLKGQGFGVGVARKRVAIATGTAIDTLRKWEAECGALVKDLPHRLLVARDAGEIKARIDADPSDRSSVDVYAWAMLAELNSQPLGEFGRAYQAKFGRRHHGPEDSGTN